MTSYDLTKAKLKNNLILLCHIIDFKRKLEVYIKTNESKFDLKVRLLKSKAELKRKNQSLTHFLRINTLHQYNEVHQNLKATKLLFD